MWNLRDIQKYLTKKKDEISVIELPSDRWKEFKDLRLQAVKDAPLMICVTEKDECERPDEKYRSLLEQSQKEKDAWMLFAKKKGKLIAMAGAVRRVPHLSAMNHGC